LNPVNTFSFIKRCFFSARAPEQMRSGSNLLNIGSRETEIVLILQENQKLSTSEVAETLNITHGMASTPLRGLSMDGFVKRIFVPQGRKRVFWEITKRGLLLKQILIEMLEDRVGK
jgi:DNA-binding MarR family transcriptional regulator